ncbi:MAG: NADH-quinone oxidoreductase subunit L [Pirellulales bacterium]
MHSVLLWLIPAAPLAAAVLIAAFGRRWLRESSHWPCVAAIAVSAACALTLLFSTDVEGLPQTHFAYQWFAVGDLSVPVSLYVDARTLMMLVMVTCVALLVAIFAIGYMHGDPGYPRFFAEVSLFVFSMTMLVLASNLLLLYVFWEAVGLCSYLLIGYWYEKPSSSAAAKKAFLVNRVGDFGFAIGIFLIWLLVGRQLNWQPPAGQSLLDYATIFDVAANLNRDNHALLLAAGLCLFAGAVGKSAQFPLHVWLPDAMEGPTPVSALIHAATMVTAGVYMVARLSPLFVLLPTAQLVIACIGGGTALLAALIALTQHDLKRILAYSTVSQLGLMFLALGSGAGNENLLAIATIAALFHLFAHAFFKALLFLGAGSVMHAMGNVIDIRRFSGLRRVVPVTHWTFLIGCLALAGIPPLSGFWSKDEILAVVGEAAQHGHVDYRGYYAALQYVAMLVSLLTAFYTFRAYFKTFWGETKIPKEAGQHAHESPRVMTWPLIALAACAALVGLALGPTHLFFHFLEHTRGLDAAEPPHMSPPVMAIGTMLGLLGILLAWFFYVRRPGLPVRLALQFPRSYMASLHKFFIDEIYARLIVRPVEGLAADSSAFDKSAIDRAVDVVGTLPSYLGRGLRQWQSGLIQSYAAIMFLGVTVLAALIFFMD